MSPESTVGCILQARVGSTRLPGKVLKEVRGKPILVHDIERLRHIDRLDTIVVATTDRAEDDALVSVLERRGTDTRIFRGSAEDVLDRFHGAAHEHGLDVIVRITSDCPLLDPRVSGLVVDRFLSEGLDYCCNNMPRTFPHGMDTEVFTLAALDEAWREATAPADREHVTPFFRDHPERFRMANVSHSRDLSHIRLTLDYPEDLRLMERIYDELYVEGSIFYLEDVLGLLERRPELLEINRTRAEGPR